MAEKTLHSAELSDHGAEIIHEIAAERARQPSLGWTLEHDDRHLVHHLVELSDRYAHRDNPDNPGYYSRANLIKAAALLVAAIERLDRP